MRAEAAAVDWAAASGHCSSQLSSQPLHELPSGELKRRCLSVIIFRWERGCPSQTSRTSPSRPGHHCRLRLGMPAEQ